MNVVMRKIDEIKPYEQNPRINDQAVDAVAASLKEFGWRQPVVVDGDGVIIVGPHEWKAAAKLGQAKVPVHVASDLTAEQIKAYRIADNQTATLADWDFDLLGVELKDLQGADYDMALLGFDDETLAKLLDGDLVAGLTGPDAVPDPPDAATTQAGDLWILGDHRLLCGDSSIAADVFCLLDGAVMDMANTDPPYNVKVEPRSSTAIAAGPSSYPDMSKKMHHQKFDVASGVTDPKKARKKMHAKDWPFFSVGVAHGWFLYVANAADLDEVFVTFAITALVPVQRFLQAIGHRANVFFAVGVYVVLPSVGRVRGEDRHQDDVRPAVHAVASLGGGVPVAASVSFEIDSCDFHGDSFRVYGLRFVLTNIHYLDMANAPRGLTVFVQRTYARNHVCRRRLRHGDEILTRKVA